MQACVLTTAESRVKIWQVKYFGIYFDIFLQLYSKDLRPRVYKSFSMLNSAEHEFYPAYNVKMPTIVGILTFISRINTASESFKARKVLFLAFWFL